jgi:hypothetical protein
LFPGGVSPTDQQTDMLDLNTEVGDGFGGEDPNENGFGFAIMSGKSLFVPKFKQQLTGACNAGPSSELTSFDKRDGSHWELYDCPEGKKRRPPDSQSSLHRRQYR